MTATSAELHSRLLRLPKEDQQSLIADLPSWRRAELAGYIQAQQRQMDVADEPDSEPLPAASSSASGLSSPHAAPSSPASSLGPSRTQASHAGPSVSELFARARQVRMQLQWQTVQDTALREALEETEALAAEIMANSRTGGASYDPAVCSNAWRHDLPSSSSEASDSDSEDLKSVDSWTHKLPSGASSSVACRALLRYLSEVTAETRRDAIRSLTRERRVDLFAYMLTPEGREVCAGAFGEEELLDPHFEHLRDHLSSSGESEEEEGSDDELYSSFTSSQRRILAGLGSEEMSSPATDVSSSSPPMSPAREEKPVSAPATPSKQQIVFRQRNVMPLGALQLQQLTSRSPELAKPAGEAPDTPIHKLQIETSGIDGVALRDWLCGRASGPLCLVRLLEGMQWARFSHQKDAKQLSSTEDLYSSSSATGYGGALGGMAGGVARAFAADVDSHLGGLFSNVDGPERGLLEAEAWVRRLVDDSGPEGGRRPKRNHLEGLDEEDINLTFRRQSVALHPHRNGGELEEYLKVHVYQEILRQWQEVAANPLLLTEKNTSRTGPGLSDHALSCELLKEHAKVVEEAKGTDVDELKAIDDKLSSHALQLSWVKEKLEAEVNFMRSRGAYTTLGLGPEATDAELARAYKIQALRLHPDRGGSTEAFQALQSAYERILKQRGGDGKKKADENDDSKADGDHVPETKDPSASPKKPVDPTKGEAAEAASEPSGPEKEKKTAQDPSASPKKPADPTESEAALAASETPGVEKEEAEKDSEEKEAQDVVPSPSATEEKAVEAEDTDKQAGDDSKNTSVKENIDSETQHGADKQAGDDAKNAPVEENSDCEPQHGDEDEDEDGLGKTASRSEDDEGKTQAPVDEDEDESDAESEHLEGLDDSETDSMDPEDLEKFLTNAAASIPAEICAGQADMALQGAHMCFRSVRLCLRAASVGPAAWPQLERLASHLLEAAQHVAEATGRIAMYAGSVPSTVMPLLDVVSKRSASLKETMVRQVMKGTNGLLQLTEKISSMSKEVSMRQTSLMQHATAVLDMLSGLIGRDEVSTGVCDGIADVLETVARLAREAAEAGAAASMAIGEGQRHAENLVEVLGAAGLWEKIDAENKSDKDKQAKKERNREAKSDDESEPEKEPWESHVELNSLLKKLNNEVMSLQKELRQLVSADPALIPAVTPVQKQALFALVAELLAQARHGVSRAWYAQWVKKDGSDDKPATFVELVEVALGFILSASKWEEVAVPSIDARLVRLAALVDSGLLCTMLREDLFQHTLQLASSEDVLVLQARFSTVAKAMKMGFVA